MNRNSTDKDLTKRTLFFAGILDVTEEGVITIDRQQNVVFFNRGAEKLFGWTKAEAIDHPLEMLIPERHASKHHRYVEEFGRSAIISRSMGERDMVHGRRKNGQEFPADISISKMLVDGKHYFTAIVRDATERHRVEAELRQLNEELGQRVIERTCDANARTEELRATTQQLWQAAKLASVGELAASIAHELNNPLGIISLRLEGLLAKSKPNDPNYQTLQIIEHEIERMATLVANLLQLCRPGNDDVSSIDVVDEINKTVDLMQHYLLQRRIEIKRKFISKSVLIHANRQKLRQVFLNLITNAADAMPSGGTLTLILNRLPLENGDPGVLIEVSDSGKGIPPEVLPKVMDPFFSTKEEGKGTGLGLAICRRIVQEHQGTIAIESALGKGTIVRMKSPSSRSSPVTMVH